MKVKKQVPTFKLGCDPELFLADINGQLKASCGLIGGTKEKPQPLTVLGDGFAIQEDNVAVEFNIPPAENVRQFVDNVARAMKVIGDGVNAGLGFHIVRAAAASFPKEELSSEQAKIFGCDPDFNAWTGRVNPKPKAADETLRSCGGHIHVGYNLKAVTFSPRQLIKLMDYYLGVPSVVMDNDPGAEERKKLYGKRGAYRSKPYGVEYRVLSNFWVHDPKLTEWAWRQTARALEDAMNEETDVNVYDKEIADIIDKNDKNAAWTMIKECGLEAVLV